MSMRARLAMLTIALLLLAPALWRVARAMPSFGAPSAQYGPTVNALASRLRHVSNMVAAVNFDFRALDTLGEETMLLCAVTGAVVLLRGARGEDATEGAGRIAGRALVPRSDAAVLACRAGSSLTLLFGLYMVLHGMVTPGGGFQGGVVVASGLLLLYLGEGYSTWRGLMRGRMVQALEAAGALLFVAAAAAPLLLDKPAMSNLMPLGTFKDAYSGGAMVIVNFAVGMAVSGGFAMLLLEFLEETRLLESDTVPDEEDA